MVAFESAPDQDWNWFKKDLLTHLPQFEDNDKHKCAVEDSKGVTKNVLDRTTVYPSECGPMTVGRWLNQATTFIYVNGNVRMAEYDENGNKFEKPVFPFQLKYVANPALKPTDGNSRFYDQLIHDGSAEIPDNTLLYTVYGKNTP